MTGENFSKILDNTSSDKIKIYVCCHKSSPSFSSDILLPIHVGKAISEIDLGIMGDNTGENISSKNRNFCELTATYWIWKNAKEDFVGLCHYRRYFNFRNDYIKIHKIKQNFGEWSKTTAENLSHIFETYDIVLPVKQGNKKHPRSLYDFYKEEHIIKDLDVTLDVIKEKYPEQYETAYKVLHDETQGYYANMLIAKKSIFDAYAEWLFSILFEVEKRIQKDVEKRDSYQQRACGFLPERLMTIYIALHPELRIKEVPVIFVEEDKKAWRKYIFRYWKRKILKKLGLRKETK